MGKKKEYEITMSTAPSKIKLSDEELISLKKKCVSILVDSLILNGIIEVGKLNNKK
ncbi:hypothetical protein [Priestia megaterium]